VEACLQDLKLPPGESFTLSDLFGDDTTGFVKVRAKSFVLHALFISSEIMRVANTHYVSFS
jgi:hypothetical protein